MARVNTRATNFFIVILFIRAGKGGLLTIVIRHSGPWASPSSLRSSRLVYMTNIRIYHPSLFVNIAFTKFFIIEKKYFIKAGAERSSPPRLFLPPVPPEPDRQKSSAGATLFSVYDTIRKKASILSSVLEASQPRLTPEKPPGAAGFPRLPAGRRFAGGSCSIWEFFMEKAGKIPRKCFLKTAQNFTGRMVFLQAASGNLCKI